MLKKAGEKMVELGADFIFTGEVLGQRPMSQTKQSLHIVAKNSGFEPFVVRPLSAKLLPITMVEEKGLVDRARLLDIQGRGRKRQMALACRYGITEYSNPAGGCLLTDPTFSKRLRDLFEHTARPAVRDIELLKYGRHFRFSEATKVIVGRNRKENEMLLKFYAPTDIVITTRDYPGPLTLIPAGCDQAFLARAASLCVSYSDAPKDGSVTTVCRMGEAQFILTAKACPREETERWMV
jgi:tRNA U34 2-thiouridine synthase MnmA/TrmU